MQSDAAWMPSLQDLVEAGTASLPLPGAGATIERWRVLAQVAAQDLALVKLFEGHTDAIAIQAELNAPAPPSDSRWGTWCAEPPQARVTVKTDDQDVHKLYGTKAWCSGATQVTHAIVSCWGLGGEPCLAAVAMDQPQIEILASGWKADGMRAADTRDVRFEGATASWVSAPGAYVNRPGFWHGGAGIAACWWGASAGIAAIALEHAAKSTNSHVLAHIGAIDVALAETAALLQVSAEWIDARPRESAMEVALRARLAVEDAAVEVMKRTGRALGAGPLCGNEKLSRAMTDLQVFLRQSHAERDLQTLGTHVIKACTPGERWRL